MMDLGDAARNKWPSLLPALGVAASSLTGKHGPCPLCGGRDRFRFDDKDGRGTWFCNSCRAGDGISLLEKLHGWTFKQVADAVRPLLGEAVEAPRRRQSGGDPVAAAQRLWNRARRLADGDEATAYLASRHHHGPHGPGLRFVPDCRVTGVDGIEHLPALLALVTAPDGKGAIVHRTYLQHGRKAAIDSPRRMMPGTIPKGSAIRLAPCEGVLGIAEGIETAKAVMRDFSMPCWSAVNATMLRDFEWPEGLRELHVFGDNDLKFAGQAAAYHLAHRAMTAVKPVAARVHIPPTPGHDWEDHGNAELARDAA